MAALAATSWPVPPAFPALATEDVHLWCAWLDHPGLAKKAEDVLSPDERKRADAYHFAVNRRHFKAARVVLRHLLAAYLGTPPAGIRFQYNAWGKPELEAPVVRFNVAHCGATAVYAVTTRGPVGVDVEAVRALPELEAIEPTLFAPEELSAQQARPPRERQREFYLRWTRREALGKAHGVGLFLEGGWRGTGHPPGWRLESMEPAPGFVGHVAYEGSAAPVRQFGCGLASPGESGALPAFTSNRLPYLPRPSLVPALCSS